MKTQSQSRCFDGGQTGFTLLEIMIAMAIFSVGFLAVGSMQISSINSNASSRLRTEATALASELSERLMMLPYDDAFLAPGSHGILPDNFPIPAGFDTKPRYTVWYVVQDETPTEDTRTIQVAVQWNANGRDKLVTLDFIKADL